MSESLVELADRSIAATYARYPLMLVKGQGCTLWDDKGNAYTDFVAGIAVCNLGHCHEQLVTALEKQAAELWHVSNLFYTGPQAQLAAWLVEHCFADRVFFANSGAEANEAAIKLARKYFKDQGQPQRSEIISMELSFHGRTMAALSATGQDKIKQGFDPLLEGFRFVPFNDIEALRKAMSPSTCAVLLEPIQGEGGVNCPAPEYLRQVRALCNEQGCLMIFDEVQTGMGRCGSLFAHQQFGVEPDIMTLAKALGNGLPIGAMLASEKVAAAFGAGAHATTFGGTPLVTAVALEVCRILEQEGLVQRAAELGEYFRAGLRQLQQRHPVIVDVRGRGLLVGVELETEGAKVVDACRQRGFLINCIQDRVLRLAPPLVIGRREIDALVECLDKVLSQL